MGVGGLQVNHLHADGVSKPYLSEAPFLVVMMKGAPSPRYHTNNTIAGRSMPLSWKCLDPGSGRKYRRYCMAPAHFTVFLSQKPSTKNVIIRPANVFLAWRAGCQGLFSKGGDVIKLRIEGSLTIPKTEIKRV